MERAMTWSAGLLAAIAAPDEDAKAAILAGLVPPVDGAAWPAQELPLRPGRPPDLRIEAHPPRRRQGLATPHGRLRFLHAIWHIEISAIDLACVACLRGAGMPAAFHADWLRIAREEAQHACLVRDLLTARGWPPGSEPVHLRLWDTTRACTDLGDHLACVPRVLEARGLDVNADLLPRVAPLDAEMHAVLHRIYLDEIGHVGAGTRWHRHWCAACGLGPERHYAEASARVIGDLRSPFPVDVVGRRAAGFTEAELAALTG
ncbi:MAG: hypothetical protein RLZZ127_767 [Planctomycetota bacterium]|jgi:uncharacterized ferritin-like protein (DUF455 family)